MKRGVVIVSGIIIGLTATAVILFNSLFMPNTIIDFDLFEVSAGLNGYEAVTDKAMENIENYEINLELINGEKESIKLKDVVIEVDREDLKGNIKGLQKDLSTKIYFLNIFNVLEIDKDKIEQLVVNINDSVKENKVDPIDAKVVYSSEYKEFVIQGESYGNTLISKSADKIIKAIKEGQTDIDLRVLGCYEGAKITSESKELHNKVEQLNTYKDFDLSYTFGNNVETINIENMNSWLEYNEDETISINKEKVKEYVRGLAAKYETYGKTRKFKTTTGKEVGLNGDYGWILNNAKMTEDIINHLENKKSEKKEPIYKQKAECFSETDFTNTYVEVSIENQTVWMYKNGEKILESPVVTGNIRKGHNTRKGVFSLTYKTRNAVLRGPGYASPVKYWMPFDGGIGLHDASWRGRFGGNIYKTNGSHGCVNMPLKAAKTIYENITSTTPIIVW